VEIRSCPLPPTATNRPAPWATDSSAQGIAVVLAFGGDVHFEGVLGVRLTDRPSSALDGSVSRLLSDANLSMVNFESALTYGACPDPQPKAYVFHAPPSALTAFKAAHVSLVTEANNHGEDCGLAGLRQSLSIARRAHYPVIGIGDNAAQAFRPYRAVVDGQRLAIFAATQVLDADLSSAWTATAHQPGLASAYQESDLVAAVRAARRNSDTVVVYLHWGTETQQCPNAAQEPLARALVRAGADIVVGAHAHVPLGAGYLRTSLVDYGLGNFAFYDTTPPETDSGTLVVTVTGRHVDHYQWRPAVINDGLPEPQNGAAAAAAVRRWNGLRACTNLSSRARPAAASGA
jgi:poly-gamma-glutamate capsule biosynthesis protein CapA/YwtB (metallophosphatase superfamily)